VSNKFREICYEDIEGKRQISRNLSYLKMDRYWAANFAKFVIFACPLSVIGYQMFNLLLLFKYEIKQNVSSNYTSQTR